MHKFALSSQVKTFWWMKIEQNRGARYFLAYIGSLNKVNPIWLRNPYYCSVYMWIGLDGYLGLHLQSWLKGSRWQFSPFLSPCIHLSGTNVKGLPWTQWTDLLGKLILSLSSRWDILTICAFNATVLLLLLLCIVSQKVSAFNKLRNFLVCSFIWCGQ